ncbi:MAG: HNH endonuclease [Myxococcales bacterium]
MLTPANRGEMLPRFFHRSKKEAMEVAATVHPATVAPRREVVTALPAASSARAEPIEAAPGSSAAAQLVQPVEPILFPTGGGVALPLPTPPRRDCAEPLSEALSRLHVTVSRRFLEKIEAARAALSHLRPGASTEHVLEAGLDLVLQHHAKRKGLVEKPRGALRSARPETLRAAVKREVWTRDGGRCQWPLESGGICGATMRVEFDHKIPRAEGGPSTAENVRLLCRVHNDLAARQRLGEAWMDQFTRRRSG